MIELTSLDLDIIVGALDRAASGSTCASCGALEFPLAGNARARAREMARDLRTLPEASRLRLLDEELLGKLTRERDELLDGIRDATSALVGVNAALTRLRALAPPEPPYDFEADTAALAPCIRDEPPPPAEGEPARETRWG